MNYHLNMLKQIHKQAGLKKIFRKLFKKKKPRHDTWHVNFSDKKPISEKVTINFGK